MRLLTINQLFDFLKKSFLIKGFQLVIVIGNFSVSEETMICSARSDHDIIDNQLLRQ